MQCTVSASCCCCRCALTACSTALLARTSQGGQSRLLLGPPVRSCAFGYSKAAAHATCVLLPQLWLCQRASNPPSERYQTCPRNACAVCRPHQLQRAVQQHRQPGQRVRKLPRWVLRAPWSPCLPCVAHACWRAQCACLMCTHRHCSPCCLLQLARLLHGSLPRVNMER